MAARPYKLLYHARLSWWRYGAAYATEEAAIRGIARRIESGELRAYRDTGQIVSGGMDSKIALLRPDGSIGRAELVDGKVELR